MDNLQKYEVELFGQKFVLSSNDGKKHELEKVVNYYKKNVDNLLKKLPNRPQLDLAILAGLKIADKLFSLAKTKNVKLINDEDKIHEIVSEAIKRLDISLKL